MKGQDRRVEDTTVQYDAPRFCREEISMRRLDLEDVWKELLLALPSFLRLICIFYDEENDNASL